MDAHLDVYTTFITVMYYAAEPMTKLGVRDLVTIYKYFKVVGTKECEKLFRMVQGVQPTSERMK